MARYTISQLDQLPDGYTLSDTDLIFATIGTSTPFLSSVKMSFKQLDTALTDFEQHWTKNLSTLSLNYSLGNVGIGTASPEANLHVKGSEGFILQSDTGGGDERWMFDANGYQGYLGIGFSATSTPGTAKLAIKEDGNVGIGTSSPNDELEVAGNNVQISLEATTDGSDNAIVFRDDEGNADGKIAYRTDWAGNTDNYMTFFTDGSNERMRIDSSGNVGIGTATPEANLSVVQDNTTRSSIQIRQDGTGDASLWFSLGGTTKWAMGVDNSDSDKFLIATNHTMTTPKLAIDHSTGNVGIGTTAPAEALHVIGSVRVNGPHNASQGLRTRVVGTSGFFGSDSTAIDVRLCPDFSNHYDDGKGLFIKSGSSTTFGNVGIGTTNPGCLLHVEGSKSNGVIAEFNNTNTTDQSTYAPEGILIKHQYSNANSGTLGKFLVCSDSATSRCIIFSNGDIDNTGNSFSGFSDVRWKENIIDATPKLDDINKLRVVNFNFNSDIDTSKKKMLGLVAQEVEEVFPGLVKEAVYDDGQEARKSVKYSILVPMLVKAVQELTAEVEDLKSKVS